MLTEKKIREMIPDILKKFGGAATKKEICDYILKHCELDPIDDLAKSNKRNEPKYVQRVGNIVSHARNKGVSCVAFKEGFELVKYEDTKTNTKWLFVLPSHTIEIRLFDIPEPKEPVTKQKKGRKINWGKIEAKRKEIGNAGEEFVYNSELKFVSDHFPDKKDKVIWVSKIEGDGLGYDIKSVCHDNPEKALLIEVKATTLNKAETPFEMTRNELNFFDTHSNKDEVLELHRLYDGNKNGFKVKIYTQKEVVNDLERTPVVFSMKEKG